MLDDAALADGGDGIGAEVKKDGVEGAEGFLELEGVAVDEFVGAEGGAVGLDGDEPVGEDIEEGGVVAGEFDREAERAPDLGADRWAGGDEGVDDFGELLDGSQRAFHAAGEASEGPALGGGVDESYKARDGTVRSQCCAIVFGEELLALSRRQALLEILQGSDQLVGDSLSHEISRSSASRLAEKVISIVHKSTGRFWRISSKLPVGRKKKERVVTSAGPAGSAVDAKLRRKTRLGRIMGKLRICSIVMR